MATAASLKKDYKNEVAQINKNYQGYINSYTNQATKEANQSIAGSNATYNNQARNAYIQSVRNQQALKQNLARGGITGGATETSLVNAQNNYLNTANKIAGDRASAANATRQQLANNIANQQLAYNQSRDTALSTARMNYDTRLNNFNTLKENKRQFNLNYKQQKKQNDINVYQMQAEGLTTQKQVKKAQKQVNALKNKATSLRKQAKQYKKGSKKYESLMKQAKSYTKRYQANSYKLAVLGSRKNTLRLEKQAKK